MSSLSLVSPPANEPVSLDEAKEHLRVTSTDQDNLIRHLISAARIYCENKLGQPIVTQTWDLKLDGFPCDAIRVPRPPLQSVTSITYLDSGGSLQTLNPSTYLVLDSTTPPASGPAHTPPLIGRIESAYGLTWPSTRYQSN